MSRRGIMSQWVIVLAIALALGGLSACGFTSAGPLQTLSEGGQPEFAVAFGYVDPGQTADMTAYVFNSASEPVTVLSAALIPIMGQAPGHLRHTGIGLHHDATSISRGWPPDVPSGPLIGARLPHGQSNIIFGFEGSDSGRDYMVAGVTITYRYRGRVYTTPALSAAVACVTTNQDAGLSPCHRASLIAQRATEKLAGR
jgi:hypothetical protein